ncbi:amidohydrolase [Microbacterium sp. HM58-2]|nr:amidohydrolase [Microbacterium sp. HM58-2]
MAGRDAGETGIGEAKSRAAEETALWRDRLIGLSHAIHGDPEIAWNEHRSAARVAEVMKEAGFDVEVGAFGVETAVSAVYGTGDLTVAICSEYDALPGIGHGCGHNVIAAAGVGAAIALKPLADEAGLRIKLLGTPAEEHGGGKVAMLVAGAWEDVDFSLMVHGKTGQDVTAGGYSTTALDRFEVTFHGRASHAAARPEKAINAGAAGTLALTALALLRQHVSKRANLNAFVSFGGEVTNVIADRCVLQVELRAEEIDTWRELRTRVLACFEGAAIATGCTMEWTPTVHPYAPLSPDPTLADLWDRNLERRGRHIDPTPRGSSGGSTDMGNVTQVLPAIHPTIAFLGEDAPAHSAAFTEAAITPAADDAVLDGATAMAWTVLDVALTPALRAEVLRRSADRPEGATRVSLEA